MKTLAKKMAITSAAFTVILGLGAASISLADNHENEEHKFGMKAEQHQMHKMMKDVTKSVEKTNTGVIVTLTSDDAETVKKLQNNERKHMKKKKEGITHTKVNISNGIQITVTGNSAESIEKIQNHSSKMGKGGKRSHQKGYRSERKAFRESLTKSVENTETGVVITLTSDDADVVEKIQNKEARQPKNEEISASKVNVENGVQITITTTNAELVEKIQKRADRKKSHRFTKRG